MKNYPPEFKADAVALYQSRPEATIRLAADLGINPETARGGWAWGCSWRRRTCMAHLLVLSSPIRSVRVSTVLPAAAIGDYERRAASLTPESIREARGYGDGRLTP
ncbi:transposase [Streptomyces sp. NPDC005962]|uniref:transposase n=1 Tax=Streptomyces sp. NPDC005962 TaxID=3154466 RepID=UPI00340615AD